ncbi:ATP-binding protein [Herbaspirillum hiltneri]|nr:ATP-binding protein [Herbaspirillum hiltneri]
MINKKYQEIYTAYYHYRTDHPFLYRAHSDVLAALECESGSGIVIVTGPSGAGKSTMAQKLYSEFILQNMSDLEGRRDIIPAVLVEAVANPKKVFDWHDFLVRLMIATGEPLVDEKIAAFTQGELFSKLPKQEYRGSQNVSVLRKSLENCLKHRNARVVFIDEAHHMLKDELQRTHMFDTIKSFATLTNTTVVLVGTYELLHIRDMSGQLVRRSNIIHFPRYDARNAEQLGWFQDTLRQLLTKLPVPCTICVDDLTTLLDIYNRSLGCVGILKPWLDKALKAYFQDLSEYEELSEVDRSRSEAPIFDLDRLKAWALPNKALRRLIIEATNGEAALSDIPIEDIAELLGTAEKMPASQSPKAVSPKKTKGRIGIRKPHRDPVGAQNHV